MNTENYCEWLRRQGYTVLQTRSSYWYVPWPRLLQACPQHYVIQPDEEELRELLQKHRMVGLRYSTPVKAAAGMISYHGVCEDNGYSLEHLGGNARSNVRRGLKRCQIERISLKRLATEGWALQQDTLDRQGRPGGVSLEQWNRACEAAEGLPGFEAWAALVDGRLAASILTARVDDTIYLLYPQSSREFLPLFVNNALVFTLTREMFAEAGVKCVFYGLHSFDAPPSVDEFKFRMGYKVRPVRQRVVFHPWLQGLFNPASHSAVAWLAGKLPRCGNLAKMEGMMRFDLLGRLPLSQQPVPPPLANLELEPQLDCEPDCPETCRRADLQHQGHRCG